MAPVNKLFDTFYVDSSCRVCCCTRNSSKRSWPTWAVSNWRLWCSSSRSSSNSTWSSSRNWCNSGAGMAGAPRKERRATNWSRRWPDNSSSWCNNSKWHSVTTWSDSNSSSYSRPRPLPPVFSFQMNWFENIIQVNVSIFQGEEGSTDVTAKSAAGWNKDPSAPSALNLNVSTSGLPAVQVTACDSPASISPIRSSADSGKALSNGHHHHGGVYASPRYQSTSGDLNDNLLVDHHHNGAHPSNGVKNSDHQRVSSSSSTPLSSSSSSSHPLFLFGVCRWPGCESPCDDLATFME